MAVAAGVLACGDSVGLEAGQHMEVVLHGLRPLDPVRDGNYELWVEPRTGEPVSLGRIDVLGDPTVVGFELPVAGPMAIAVSVESPGDVNDGRSTSVLLAGPIGGRGGRLVIAGSVTDGRPLERDPGHHSLFTSSNNVEHGYPSLESSGLWLFSISVQVNKHRTREVKLTPLQRGWVYEGWIVREIGVDSPVWISYGKFRPDPLSLLTSRDHTGSGLFSGDADFVNGGVEDVPGDEWTTTRIADQFGVALPGGLEVPLELDAVDPISGDAVWAHVITIEPAFDEGEGLTTERPFTLRPYRNAIGEGSPALPRRIIYQENEPFGEVRTTP